MDDEHHNRCETACLDCLLSFAAQQAMHRNLLNRQLAFSVLDTLLKGETYNIPEQPSAEEPSVLSQDHQAVLARARERLKQRKK